MPQRDSQPARQLLNQGEVGSAAVNGMARANYFCALGFRFVFSCRVRIIARLCHLVSALFSLAPCVCVLFGVGTECFPSCVRCLSDLTLSLSSSPLCAFALQMTRLIVAGTPQVMPHPSERMLPLWASRLHCLHFHSPPSIMVRQAWTTHRHMSRLSNCSWCMSTNSCR